MYLSNIKLWNFRKFGEEGEIDLAKPHLDLDLNKGLNVIIGENDSGKTAIIDAIKLVLKTHSYEWIKVDNKDFFNYSNRFRIELIFKDLSPNEAKNFTKWLSWDNEDDKIKPFLKLHFDVTRKDNKILYADIKAGTDDEGYLMPAEAKGYLKATYLKPLRDTENELIAKKNSRLSQILLGDEIFKNIKDDNKLMLAFSNLKNELENYFNDDDTGGKHIKDKIDGYIKNFYGKDKETEFEASGNNIKSILEKLSLSIKGSTNLGLGTLNRLFMAAELLHLNKSNWSGLRLGLIEELEAHLHPQAQIQVIETLQEQDSIQLILTTHSPNLASKVKLENLIICNNNYAFPMGHKYTKLRKSDYPFFERFLDVTKSNLFFANGLILVEGISEELIIPSIAKLLWDFEEIDSNLISKKVSIIAIGNTSFKRYIRVFLRYKKPYFNIPISVVNDFDLRPIEFAKKYRLTTTKAKKKHLIVTEFDTESYRKKKMKEYNHQNIKLFLSNYWTLEYCIALHPKLNKILFGAILQTIEEIRADKYQGEKTNKKNIRIIPEKRIEKLWKAFTAKKNKEQIAFDIMHEYIIKGKRLSKAIIAMHFANGLETSGIDKEDLLIDNNPIQYLIDAIKYATGN